MTVVLESYKDPHGIRADIEQDKYCRSYRLDVYDVHSDGLTLTLFRKDGYHSIDSARRAMRRLLEKPIVKTYDHKKEGVAQLHGQTWAEYDGEISC